MNQEPSDMIASTTRMLRLMMLPLTQRGIRPYGFESEAAAAAVVVSIIFLVYITPAWPEPGGPKKLSVDRWLCCRSSGFRMTVCGSGYRIIPREARTSPED